MVAFTPVDDGPVLRRGEGPNLSIADDLFYPFVDEEGRLHWF